MHEEEISIYIDPDTGVNYLITETGAVCPRYDSDNSLFVSPVWERKNEIGEHEEVIVHVDSDTGVNYLISETGAICPRYNYNGSLHVSPVPEKKGEP